MIRKSLKTLLTRHALLTLLIMLISALLLGLTSYNLFFFLNGNLQLVADFGIQALQVGALEELLKLSAYGILSVLFYIVFKACEKVLVEWILK